MPMLHGRPVRCTWPLGTPSSLHTSIALAAARVDIVSMAARGKKGHRAALVTVACFVLIQTALGNSFVNQANPIAAYVKAFSITWRQDIKGTCAIIRP